MRTLRFPVIHRILILTGACCLIFAAPPRSFASADDRTDEALATAKAWVSQIDAGNYEASYAAGGDALHEKVDLNKWSSVLQTFRTPWGEVVNRTQTSHIYKPNGFAGAEGEFMVIAYNTSFKKLDDGMEVVVLKWEEGKWRPAGYTCGAKPSETPEDQSQPQTEVTTKTVHNPNTGQ